MVPASTAALMLFPAQGIALRVATATTLVLRSVAMMAAAAGCWLDSQELTALELLDGLGNGRGAGPEQLDPLRQKLPQAPAIDAAAQNSVDGAAIFIGRRTHAVEDLDVFARLGIEDLEADGVGEMGFDPGLQAACFGCRDAKSHNDSSTKVGWVESFGSVVR
jgi:hypothetical protein